VVVSFIGGGNQLEYWLSNEIATT